MIYKKFLFLLVQPFILGAFFGPTEAGEALPAENLALVAPSGIRASVWEEVGKQLRLSSGREIKLERKGVTTKELGILIDNMPSGVKRSLRILKLNSNLLTEIPLNMVQLSGLEQLDLSNNRITNGFSVLEKLYNLRLLSLVNNGISRLPLAVCFITRLAGLDLCDNPLGVLPEEIKNLTHLQTLIIDNVRISIFPASLAALKNLRQLSIKNNPGLSVAYTDLAQFEKLTYFVADPPLIRSCLKQLCLQRVPGINPTVWRLVTASLCRSNPLGLTLTIPGEPFLGVVGGKAKMFDDAQACSPEVVSDTLVEYESAETKLTTESLAALINALPQFIRTLVAVIDLSDNLLTRLPAEIKYFAHVQVLGLRNNQLIELPDELGYLKHLERILLCGNQLTALPRSLGSLEALTEINVDHNCFVEFPPAITALANLANLSVKFNRLTTLPAAIANLQNLQLLDVSFNQLAILPKELFGLTCLQQLKICGNQLQELPDFIGFLTNLSSLEISLNKITEIPKSIRNLLHLAVLRASCNRIKFLPPEMSDLVNLKVLSVGGNLLWDLPRQILRLKSLYYFEARNNPFIFLDDPEIIAYLNSRKSLMIDQAACQQLGLRAHMAQYDP